MAITFSNISYDTDGSRKKVYASMAITSGTGTVTPAALGLTQIDSFEARPTGGHVFQYTPSTGVVLAMFGADATTGGVLLNNGSASLTNIPVEAVGY